MMRKNISLLGSTGSIGRQALEIIREQGEQRFKIVALACNRNIDLLEAQAKAFQPKLLAVFDEERADMLRERVDIQVISGMQGLKAAASEKGADTVINSLVGSIGVEPTVSAITAGKDVALANKETLVAAGDIVMGLAKKHGVSIKPIDSEHSAIFQCLQGQPRPRRIILTCSGGAFRDKSADEMRDLKAEDALKHPNWAMGPKITVDSATLMNKGFEVIEAHMLFGLDYDHIDVILHPQSIVHSLVEFQDTSVLAQLGWPDMRLPIQYALTHPERLPSQLKPLDLIKVGRLDFGKPDLARFPCLGFAFEAGRTGGTLPAVMNAANEVAVAAFLDGRIGFLDIAKIIRKQMDQHKVIKEPSLAEILETDKAVKAKTGGVIDE
ncbi:MAG: 1-deoxy-D-xylulose-5-phosphate reductoisomerase [Nanoarchaeota archaeon]